MIDTNIKPPRYNLCYNISKTGVHVIMEIYICREVRHNEPDSLHLMSKMLVLLPKKKTTTENTSLQTLQILVTSNYIPKKTQGVIFPLTKHSKKQLPLCTCCMSIKCQTTLIGRVNGYIVYVMSYSLTR